MLTSIPPGALIMTHSRVSTNDGRRGWPVLASRDLGAVERPSRLPSGGLELCELLVAEALDAWGSQQELERLHCTGQRQEQQEDKLKQTDMIITKLLTPARGVKVRLLFT
jgi:hypothetical protein